VNIAPSAFDVAQPGVIATRPARMPLQAAAGSTRRFVA
jgi:hypothetical protein